MAIKKTDHKTYKGTARLKNKFFGVDNHGQTLEQATRRGLKRGVTMGTAHLERDQDTFLKFMQGLGVFTIALLYQTTDGAENRDFEVPYDAALHADITTEGGVRIYNAAGNHEYLFDKYMLVNTSDGYQILASVGVEDLQFGEDNRFILMTDRVEAARIAAEMSAKFYDITQGVTAEAVDFPYTLSYEGVSGFFNEEVGNIPNVLGGLADQHRIADGYIGGGIEHMTDASENLAAWQGALMQYTTAAGSLDAINVAVNADHPEANHFDSVGDELTRTAVMALSIYGGLLALGTAGGFASGVNRSRRRFNKDVKKNAPQ